MIPNPDYEYPECLAESPLEEKKKLAVKLYSQYGVVSAIGSCQDDFRLASLVAYKIAADYYGDVSHDDLYPETMRKVNQLYLPVRYCGGNMCFGRVFSINHCAFSSPDSIIGFRDSEYHGPQEYFKILKGLKFIGIHRNWVLFKLDRNSTDDMTGMLYSPLEKNFTVEFAHFPHDAERRIIFRWKDC